jgi:hypothetical protein
MNVSIKLSKEQHSFLLSRFGDEESIREWMETEIDNTLLEKSGIKE